MIKSKTELRDLLLATNQLVVMDNYHVQHHCNTLTRLESTVLAWLISKIKPYDKPSTRYTVDCDELLSVMCWTDMRYCSVKDAMQNLTKATWWLIGSRTKNQGYIVCEEVSYEPRLIHVWFLPSTHRYLFQLNQRYATKEKPLRAKAYSTSYPLAYHTVMPHRYSVRIYEFLRSHINKSTWIVEFGTGSNLDIQHILGQWHTDNGTDFSLPTSWKNWGTFKRDVLDPAQKDLDTYADITFTYKGFAHDMARHTTRSVRCIMFKIHVKTEEEQKEAARAINAKYRAYINAWSTKHLGNKLCERNQEINTDIFSYQSPTLKPKRSGNDAVQNESDIHICDHDTSSSMDFDPDFATLNEYDEDDLPF